MVQAQKSLSIVFYVCYSLNVTFPYSCSMHCVNIDIDNCDHVLLALGHIFRDWDEAWVERGRGL